MYDSITYPLLFFGINVHLVDKNRQMKIISFICIHVFYISSVVFALTGILIIDGLQQNPSQNSLSAFIIYYTGFVFRWKLQRKRGALSDLLHTISEFRKLSVKRRYTTNAKKKVRFFIILTILLQGVILMLLLFSILRNPDWETDTSHIITEQSLLKNINPKIITKVWMLSMVLMYVHNVIPFCLFGILYATVSYDLKEILRDFAVSLKSIKQTISRSALTYNRICTLIDYADKTLSYLLFFSILYTSSILYFNTFKVLPNLVSAKYHVTISVLNIVFLVFFLFGMLNFASEIPCLVTDIGNIIHVMHVEENCAFKKIEFLLKIHQGLFLTVGEMVPIRKGLFLVLIGTIATYCLLVRSFRI